MLDMLIQGGRVVTPAGVGNWDVGIMGEQIVAVAFPGILPATAKQVIDARGKIVVPGGIETHAHAVANVQPGARTLVSGVPNAGPLEHSLGAIWGGTTTVVDFAPVPTEGDLAQGIHDYLTPWQGNAYTDYSTHCIYTSRTPPDTIARYHELVVGRLPQRQNLYHRHPASRRATDEPDADRQDRHRAPGGPHAADRPARGRVGGARRGR